MRNTITFLTIIFFSYTSVLAQSDFTDLKFDSTKTFKNKGDTIYQIDYFLKSNLIMQKFYPNGSSIGDFCDESGSVSTNYGRDSILVHLGYNNFIAEFSSEKKFIYIKSWTANSNILRTVSYNNKGDETYNMQQAGTPYAMNAYAACKGQYDQYYIGELKELHNERLTVVANYDEGLKYSKDFKDATTLDPVFLKLKDQAISILKSSYGKKMLSKIIFNPEESCYYEAPKKERYYSRKAPSHNSGTRLLKFNKEEDKIKLVDFVFDIQIEDSRFSCISLRLDSNGTLINKKILVWGKYQNTSLGLSEHQIKKIITPTEAMEIAKKNSKWPIHGGTSVNMVWETEAESDTVGKLIYQINYDFIAKGKSAWYARQVQIAAIDGTYLKEAEINEQLMGIEDSKKFKENGKWGFRGWGREITPPEYDQLPNYPSQFMIVIKDGKYGVINKKNEVVIDFIYNSIDYHKSSLDRYNYRYAILKKDESVGFFDRYSGMLFDVQYKSIWENEKEQIIAISKEGKQVVFDLRTGKLK